MPFRKALEAVWHLVNFMPISIITWHNTIQCR